ncbi:MAG: UDP-glucose/GDP-mannose dehydrogenase family protein [Ignavibacteriaceae bacterium]|jgi:nucleotide sugar dehydrogenase|nr:MAG: UDP-glucose/GDP-mannose dehydrogenase family protein [Chlorobiota bacterium]KXK04696.1 MAG: nucleotide sugar dehydrogenase [Chlorobi bacterium OLB4]MBV6399441.1 UDP-glucose 6-dehydrogenase TuaD [Ignavibacteria bacterium]MCC6886715.1 UDP-glucose/GDP-mannose dehydrogenase family protein [Ignavibacteriales bacterium]MCE7953146.1 UDP-glucose/GDP-mannose dehydrogenase family protein [Chlorobi bacterium CHB7]MEB2329071.1 UDP-glucose/GDP-mannose dehydrogenase family protein [Ignavibacteriacea
MNISIIGTGYVGLVSGTCFAEMGNNVICVDNNPDKLSKLRNAQVTIYEPGLELIFQRSIEKSRLSFTDDLKSAVEKSDVIFLCLPTPQGEDGSADLKYVLGVADNIGAILKANSDKEFKIIVNKSTVPVGTAQKVSNEISKHGVNNFDVVSNPEFLREGFAVEDFMKPDRIVIGASNENSFKTMRRIYEPFVRQGNPILEMDTASAEVTKYAANSYLAMRITYMNQLANYCEKAGANIDLVRRGMGTDNRIGRRFLFAGIGYGGSCFPKDVNALIKTSIESESEMTLLSEVNRVNKLQKLVLVTKVLDYYKGDIDGKTFGVWGLAFKPNTDDMREAPSVVIINEILKYGAKVKAYDPAAMEAARFDLKDTIEYCPDEFAALEGSDALLIFTEWNEFRNPPLAEIKSKIKDNVIFDGRNLFTPEQMKQHGINYFSIGRKPVLI